ncbi:unnamed protein product [Ixodes persulcatus]
MVTTLAKACLRDRPAVPSSLPMVTISLSVSYRFGACNATRSTKPRTANHRRPSA